MLSEERSPYLSVFTLLSTIHWPTVVQKYVFTEIFVACVHIVRYIGL